MEERLLANTSQIQDEEDTLRPQSLKEYIGQSQLKETYQFY